MQVNVITFIREQNLRVFKELEGSIILLSVGGRKTVPPVPGGATPPVGTVGCTPVLPTLSSPPFPMEPRLPVEDRNFPLLH